MSLIKKYKNVNIYFDIKSNNFYCNVKNESELYRHKTFNSTSIEKIQKAIDSYEEEYIDGEIYFKIGEYSCEIKQVQEVKKIANLIFYDDGSSSIPYNLFFKKEFANEDDFILLNKLSKNYYELAKKIDELYKEKQSIGRNFVEIVRKNYKFKK